MSELASNTQSTILDRALGNVSPPMTAGAAEYFLSIRLDPLDENRANELAKKACDGSITTDEQAEMDEYRRVGRVIESLKLRAKTALNAG